MLPRNSDYVIVGKCEILHLYASMPVHFLGFRNNFSLRPVFPLGQFPPNVVEAKFGQTPFCIVIRDRLFFNFFPSFFQNDLTYRFSPSGLRTLPG